MSTSTLAKQVLLTAAMLLLVSIHAQAENVVWTNTAGGAWHFAFNWSPNQLPSAEDTAIITNSGSYSVRFDGDDTVGALVLGGSDGPQTLNVRIHGVGLDRAEELFPHRAAIERGTCQVDHFRVYIGLE